jgi:uncharacterized membrane protein YhaH (DUF805 family)
MLYAIPHVKHPDEGVRKHRSRSTRSSGMGFSEAISTCCSKFFVFQGRASRSEFWYFRLFVVIYNITLAILVGIFPQSGAGLGAGIVIVMSIGALLLLMPDISVQVRRFHDHGISGFWLLPTYLIIPTIAILALYMNFSEEGLSLVSGQTEAFILLGCLWSAGFLFNLIVSILPGERGANKYGADPLEGNGSSSTSKAQSTSIFKEQGYSGSSQAKHSSSQPSDALTQGIAQAQTEKQNSGPVPIAGVDEASAILLKYNDEARVAYSKLQEYPVEWQNEYRQRLVENRSQDPEALVGIVVLNFLGRPDLAWTSDVWEVLEATRLRSKTALDEFIKVFSLLSHTMGPKVIADKVIAQTVSNVIAQTVSDTSRGTLRLTYLVSDAKEIQQEVHYYSGGYYNVSGSLDFFANIEDVYVHLNTPKARRVKPFLLSTVE